MTFRQAVGFFVAGGVVSVLPGLVLGTTPGVAHARGEPDGARTVVVPCDRHLSRATLGEGGNEQGLFAVREFPGKAAADLARVRVLARLRQMQSPTAAYTENAPVFVRDGAVMVACDGARSGSPEIESVLLVLPE